MVLAQARMSYTPSQRGSHQEALSNGLPPNAPLLFCPPSQPDSKIDTHTPRTTHTNTENEMRDMESGPDPNAILGKYITSLHGIPLARELMA